MLKSVTQKVFRANAGGKTISGKSDGAKRTLKLWETLTQGIAETKKTSKPHQRIDEKFMTRRGGRMSSLPPAFRDTASNDYAGYAERFWEPLLLSFNSAACVEGDLFLKKEANDPSKRKRRREELGKSIRDPTPT